MNDLKRQLYNRFTHALCVGNSKYYKILKDKDKVEKLDFKTWLSIVSLSFKEIGNAILSEQLGFLLPINLGMLRVEGKKFNTKATKLINFINAKRKEQYNFHSFNKVYTVNWLRTDQTRFVLAPVYSFKAVRTVNRALAQNIFAGNIYMDKQGLKQRLGNVKVC